MGETFRFLERLRMHGGDSQGHKGSLDMINHERMRELLNHKLGEIQKIAEFMPNEVVYKALVIREFMEKRGIQDPRAGIREFTAFVRDRLTILQIVPERVKAAAATSS
jgi:hypothetical protein